VVVDVNALPGLDHVEAVNGHVRVGALVRQRALEASPLTPERLPLVAEALPHVGHFVTRGRGTIGGSIAHADAAAELPLCLAVLGGSVVTRSADSGRELGADEFFVTHFTTTLAPDELVVETVWPVLGRGWGFAFEELSQRRGDFGLAIAACALRVEDRRVAEARVGVASVVERPTLLETELAGEAVTEDVARATGESAAAGLAPFENLHAPAEYQRHLAGVLIERAIRRAWRNTSEGAA
jgi:CO/xanthine dehydrogenase FAD-binding subunit